MTEESAQAMAAQIRAELGSVRQEFSACASTVSSLEAEIQQYKQSHGLDDLKSTINELSSKFDGFQEQRKQTDDVANLQSIVEELSSSVNSLHEQRKQGNDNVGLKSTLDTLSSRVDGLETLRSDLSKDIEKMNSTLEVQSAALNDRTEMEILHNSCKSLTRNEEEIRASVGKVQAQMRALEKELRNDRLKMGGMDRRHISAGSGRRPSESFGPDISGLSDELRLAIHDEIKEQQAAVDGVLSEKLENLEGQLRNVAKQFVEVDRSLTTFCAQYATDIDRTAADLLIMKTELASVRSPSIGLQ
jgi:archaellum component FlaC